MGDAAFQSSLLPLLLLPSVRRHRWRCRRRKVLCISSLALAARHTAAVRLHGGGAGLGWAGLLCVRACGLLFIPSLLLFFEEGRRWGR